MFVNFFLAVHNLLCGLIWGGNAPEWLSRLHERFGWLVGA
jgi:hypothetical protein